MLDVGVEFCVDARLGRKETTENCEISIFNILIDPKSYALGRDTAASYVRAKMKLRNFECELQKEHLLHLSDAEVGPLEG